MTDPYAASGRPDPSAQAVPDHPTPSAVEHAAAEGPAVAFPPAGTYPAPPPGYPVAPAAHGLLPPSGRRFWGLLFLMCIPYVGVIVALIVALVQRSAMRHSPYEVIRENARWAANWALSYTIYGFVLLAATVAAAVLTADASADGQPAPWALTPYLVLVAAGIYCLVTLIRGCVIADRRVHRPFLAIPFFRS